MQRTRSLFSNKYFLLFLCIFAATGYSYAVIAAQLPNGTTPPAGGYVAGDSILDPGCAPGSSNCFQNIGGWGLNGNAGTTPGTNFIGTTDSQAFVVKTNNTEALRVLADGKVGIGTTNPTHPLQVDGTDSVGILYDNTAGHSLIETNAGDAFQSGYYIHKNGVEKAQLAVLGNSDDLSFSMSGTERMRITNGGNIGINTQSPGYKLEVAGDFLNTFTHGDGTQTQIANNDNLFGGGEQGAGVISVDPIDGYFYGSINGDIGSGAGKAVQNILLDFATQKSSTITNEWNNGDPRISLFNTDGLNSTGSLLSLLTSGAVNLASSTTGGINTGIELDGTGFHYNYDGTFFTMPTADGTNGQAMVTDGSGHFSWATVGGGSPTTPGGANTNIQYNNSGAFAGTNDFTWNNTTKSFHSGGTIGSDILNFTAEPGTFSAYATHGAANNSFSLDTDGSAHINSTVSANIDSFMSLDSNGTVLWLNDHAANTSVDIGGKVNSGNTMGILETRNLNTNMRYGFTSFKDNATFFRCNDNIPGATPCADDRAVYVTNGGVTLFTNKNSDDISNYLRNSIDIADGAITLRYEQVQGSPTTPGANTSLIMNDNLIWNGDFVGLGVTPSTGDKLEVFGDIRVGTSGANGCLKDFSGGTITGTCSSDERLKMNILPVTNVLDKLTSINLVTYDWNELAQSRGFSGGISQLGVLAQNVEQVFPELVITDKDGYKQVNYGRLNLLNLQAIRELDIKITAIENFTSSENSSFKTALMSWLGSDTNGLQNISSNKVTTHQLCVDGQCLTENDLRQLIELKNQMTQQDQGSQGQLNNDPVVTPLEAPTENVPEVAPQPEPVPENTPVIEAPTVE